MSSGYLMIADIDESEARLTRETFNFIIWQSLAETLVTQTSIQTALTLFAFPKALSKR